MIRGTLRESGLLLIVAFCRVIWSLSCDHGPSAWMKTECDRLIETHGTAFEHQVYFHALFHVFYKGMVRRWGNDSGKE